MKNSRMIISIIIHALTYPSAKKEIKAVVVNGRRPIKTKDEAGFSALVKKLQRQLNQEPLVKLLREFGSPYLFMLINRRIGMGRAYNGLSVKFPQNEDISPRILKEKYFSLININTIENVVDNKISVR